MAVLSVIEQKEKISNIMDSSNVPYRVLQEIIKNLLNEELVEQIETLPDYRDKRVKRILRLTEIGRKKLQLWREFVGPKNNKGRT